MEKFRKILLLSFKIGIGSSVAIYIAQSMHLDYAVSAGTITLLTLMTSKWETIKLSVCRLATFTITLLTAWLFFSKASSIWVAYGFLLFFVVLIAEVFEWRATISVNAVIAAHLVTNQDFSDNAVWNEFLLVLIGIIIAIVLNLFYANYTHKREITAHMRYTENKLQSILGKLAAHLSNKQTEQDIGNDINALEKQIQNYIQDAYEYQDNTFPSHPEYYIFYFEMRYEQCRILHNVYCEIEKINSMPAQADMVSEYLLYLTDYVIEINNPDQQIEKLNKIFTKLKHEELPKTGDEFENRAKLYHIILDIEDFLMYKAKFVNKLDNLQMKKYWKVPGKKG
jgi:Predicted membrane protein